MLKPLAMQAFWKFVPAFDGLASALLKAGVPITVVQRRELYSDRELRQKAGSPGQGSLTTMRKI
jgi:hypothetical protein